VCPQRFVPESYNPEKLRLLQQVFDDTWEQFALEHPTRDLAKDEEWRTQLARAIVAHADGLADPDELRRLAKEKLTSLVG
jgi:hypothetical protein